MSQTPETPFRRRKRTRPGRVLAAIVLAVLLHGLFVLLLIAAQNVHLGPTLPVPEKKQAVALRTLSPEQWAQNRGQHRDLPSNAKAAPKPRPKPPPEKNPDGQVVAVAPGNDQAPPPDAKYLAEHNNTVKKETRSRETSSDYRNPMPHRTTTAPVTPKPPQVAQAPKASGNGGKGNDEKPKQEAHAKSGGLEVPDVKPRDQIAMRTPKDGKGPGLRLPNQPESDELHGNSNRLNLQPPGKRGDQAGQDGSAGRAGNPGFANLVPNQAMLDKIDGAAANDHLQDVDEGDDTFLNTKEWKFAGFFNRVKQGVGTQWNPGSVLHRRDPTGNVYGSRDRYTMLSVTLSPDGSLKDVHVTKSSGLEFLDEEAIAAFQRAQPFPNPPPGLLASDQQVHFQFGFFLDLSGMHGLRLFR